MTDDRKDTASLLIKASAAKIYQALTEQSAIRQWKTPQGMYMEIFHYYARPDDTCRIALCYEQKVSESSKTFTIAASP